MYHFRRIAGSKRSAAPGTQRQKQFDPVRVTPDSRDTAHRIRFPAPREIESTPLGMSASDGVLEVRPLQGRTCFWIVPGTLSWTLSPAIKFIPWGKTISLSPAMYHARRLRMNSRGQAQRRPRGSADQTNCFQVERVTHSPNSA